MHDVAICDDYAPDREQLRTRILVCKVLHGDIRVHEYESGIELLESMNKISFAVIFLDIQMRGMDGDETAREIRTIDPHLILVYYTGFAEPSPRRIEVQPYRYIMKNMPEQVIDTYINEIMKKVLDNDGAPSVLAKIRRDQILIQAKHIVYIEKYNKNTKIHLAENAYEFYGLDDKKNDESMNIRLVDKMENIYEKLKRYGFGCPHDSYIVNFTYVNFCTSKEFHLAGIKNSFQITRGKAKEFIRLKDLFVQSKYKETI